MIYLILQGKSISRSGGIPSLILSLHTCHSVIWSNKVYDISDWASRNKHNVSNNKTYYLIHNWTCIQYMIALSILHVHISSEMNHACFGSKPRDLDINLQFFLLLLNIQNLTHVSATDLREAWGCSRALWPSRVGGGVGGGKRARGLRVCLGGLLCLPGAVSAFLQRSPLPLRPRPAPGQHCPEAPRSSLHRGAPLGLFHAGAVGEVSEGW